jgi:tetraacyldisaccharide 4'-kinase
MGRAGETSSLPVICAGNFVVGGAGKTPFAIELARRLSLASERPIFLTRGYGGCLEGPVLVTPKHGAAEVGDEALLLARHAPTVVSRARGAGAKLAEAAGGTVIIMDDGLQNPSLTKDLSFAVVDAAAGVGNGLCLPAGPLRVPLEIQWRFVQALIVIGGGPILPERRRNEGGTSTFLPGLKISATWEAGQGDMPALQRFDASKKGARGPIESGSAIGESARGLIAEANRRGLPILSASLLPEPSSADALRGQKVLAFAGIGRPEKFFATLRAIGAVLVAERGFPDHHRFRGRELERLAGEARRSGAILVTTEKDMVRVSEPDSRGTELASILSGVTLRVLRVSLSVADGERLDSLLRHALRQKRAAKPA